MQRGVVSRVRFGLISHQVCMQAAQNHVGNRHIGTQNDRQGAHDAHSDDSGPTWQEFVAAVDYRWPCPLTT